MKGQVDLMRGVKCWVNKRGSTVMRLHYEADPAKDPLLNPAWIEQQRKAMTDPALFQQELEIDFGATGGALIYQYTPEATEEDEFVVPHTWTRYTSLDPHPVKPHALLWVAVDPYGICHAYREYWPSKVYNMPGGVPDNDNRINVRDYVEAWKFLESEENVQNGGVTENVYRRVIDYAARAFGKGTSDDNPNEQSDFQTRFENVSRELNFDLFFEDAKKGQDVGYEIANSWLKPVPMLDPKTGEIREMSHLRIMRQRCPELIWQLKNNRRRKQTAVQAENDDPQMRAIRKRNDLTDSLCYLLRFGPEYVDPSPDISSNWTPTQKGVSY